MRSRVTQQLQQILTQSRPAVGKAVKFKAKAKAKADETSAVPTIPEGFSPHDYAVFLLQVAAEIEHGLLIQYLFAAYSLGGPQVPETQRAHVQRWQTLLLGIAREEMGHFITVQNVLKLIGGALNLERNDFPWDLPFYPFPFALEPLSRKLLARYVCIESPENWPDNWKSRQKEIEELGFGKGGSDGFKRVGEIYAKLRALLADKALIPDDQFHADTLTYQASFDEWGRGYKEGSRGAVTPGAKTPNVLIYTAYSRQTALDAVDAIAQQGEAADGDNQNEELSHFERFMELYLAFPEEGASWSPCRPVVSNPRALGDPDVVPGTTYLVNEDSRRWAKLLNLRYRMLLNYLSHSFRLSGATGLVDGQARGAILNRAFSEMYNLRAISGILVTLPCGKPNTAARAGPSFELPYTLKLPYLERDVWRLHLDVYEAAQPLIVALHGTAGAAGDAYLASLKANDANSTAMVQAVLSSGPGPAQPRLAAGLT